MNAQKARSRRRFALAVFCVAFASLLCAAPVKSAQALDYQNLGSLRTEAGWTWVEDATLYTFLLTNEMTHSLEFDAGRIAARSRIALPAPTSVLLTSALETSPSETDPFVIGAASISMPEASLTLYPFDQLTVRAGWFDLDWGAGYVFDPGNALGKSIGSEVSTFGGAGAASFSGVSFQWSPSYQLSIGAAGSLFPDPAMTSVHKPWLDTAWAVWADGYAGTFDYFAGLQGSPGRFLRPSMGASVELAGFILGAEAGLELDEPFSYPTAGSEFAARGRPQPFATGFFSWQYGGETTSVSATGEYLFTDLGYNEAEFDRLVALVELAGGVSPLAASTGPAGGSLPVAADAGVGAPPLGRHYLLAQLEIDVRGLLSLSMAALVNLQDGSHVLDGRVAVVTIPAVDLFVAGTFLGGPTGQGEYSLAGPVLLVSAGAKVVW